MASNKKHFVDCMTCHIMIVHMRCECVHMRCSMDEEGQGRTRGLPWHGWDARQEGGWME